MLIDDDSLSVVVASGGLTLVDQVGPWRGHVNRVPVVIGGTCWSKSLPNSYGDGPDGALVAWLSHHNVGFGGVDEAWLRPRELPGIDLLVNGHLHRPLANIVCGQTTWINPGNIARVQRADAVREARPAALRLDIRSKYEWTTQRIDVPHESFDSVFHELGPEDDDALDGSAFIRGLESLRTLRTAGGAGLMEFLHKNLNQFDSAVSAEILSLASEVCTDEQDKAAKH
jgi:predicted phosphodiesterase